jgi:DNA-binding IclR family transcriptional regulator
MTAGNSSIVLRATSRQVLDQVRLARGPLDFLDALILMAITQANVDPIVRDPELNRTFATYQDVPPDDLRRPISINAVAQSLGAPFETVRRRVTRLSRAGIYRITPTGVVVPGWVVLIATHRASLEAGYERTRALYVHLARLGALGPTPVAEPWQGPAPLRAVARLGADYLLRLITTASAEIGDLSDAAIWLEVLRSSQEHLPDEAGIDRMQSRPVRVAGLARRMGMPFETVRRRVADLVARELCEAAADGVTLAGSAASDRTITKISEGNHRDLARLFTAMGHLGVLAAWSEDPALAA